MSRSRRSSYTSTYFSALKLASVLCVSAVGAGAGAAGAARGASARAASARIAGAAWQSLDSSSGTAWTATPGGGVGGAVPAVVPGDLISDLARAGAIADPWRDLTWRAEAGRWDLQAWEFAADFATPAWAAAGGRTLLVFDSVKLAADATLNGAPLALARSQHLRSALDVTAALARGAGAANALRVVFPPTVNDTRNDDGRFQGCSGGWCVRDASAAPHPRSPRSTRLPNPNHSLSRTPQGLGAIQ